MAKQPKESNHSLYFPEADIRIHLQLEGIVSYFSSRKQMIEELRDAEGHYIPVTPNLLIWDPHTEEYRDQEYGMTDYIMVI